MISWSIAGAVIAVIGIPLVILAFDLWTKAAEKAKKKPEAEAAKPEEKKGTGSAGS